MTHTQVYLGGWLVVVALLLSACAVNRARPIDRSVIGEAPGTYSLTAGTLPVSLPFEYYGMNLLVHARMNNVDISMLIDNGVMWDELWFYSTSMADTLGLACGGEVLVTGACEGEGVDSYEADDITISFGDVTFQRQTAIVSDASQGFDKFFPGIAGQVCGAFFKHFIVGFNFDEMCITLYDPATFVYNGNGLALPMTRDSIGSYSIPLQVQTDDGRRLDIDASIDLGGIYGLNLPLCDSLGLHRPQGERLLLGYGASGPIYGYRTSLPHLTLGEYVMNDVLSVLIDSPEGDAADFTVGLPVFRRYNLVFDYFHNLLYIEPNASFHTPFSEDER